MNWLGDKVWKAYIVFKKLYAEFTENPYDTVRRKTTKSKNEQEIWRHFTKARVRTSNRFMKRCLTSFVTKKMQIKTAMRYYFILNRMAIINKTDNNK